MVYYSLNRKSPTVSFSEAVIKGLAPDKGLYFPEAIPKLPAHFFATLQDKTAVDIGIEALKPFVGTDLPLAQLREILVQVLNFDFPLVTIEKNIAALELFHGPTMAFKDVGARFMALSLSYFLKQKHQGDKVTVLVATSGDTGGAVAQGFLGVPGIDVVILYPSGKVSEIQEKQLTTLGKNITALEVSGTFDDCQNMVKTAFLDPEITQQKTLTSANSINVARWLPQLLYFFIAYKELQRLNKNIIFSVPSGNFGNICAGIVAYRLGLPIHHFIAATNSNDTVVKYLETGNYNPQSSIATISNAMDVGNPSNFIRIQNLFDNELDKLKSKFTAYSFSDSHTRTAMKTIYEKSKYIADPHGAVGYLGLKKHELQENEYGVFLETAHPVKFLDTVSGTIGIKPTIPKQIEKVLHNEKKSIAIVSYEDLKNFLIN